MSDLSQHGEWLSLIDVSGPFLAEPVLKQVFPQGLEQIDPLNRKAVRQAYEEWREAIDLDDPQLPAFQKAWVELVLKRVLELDEDDEEDILKPRAKLSDALTHLIPEHGVTLRPDFAVVDEQNDDRPLMLIQVFSHDVNLDEPVKGDGWATSPAERMVALCRANDVRLGLLTNGERWMLTDAPVGAVTTFASWYARLWGQETITLQAFVNLLGIRRFFVDPSEQLPALFDESLKLQDEVTDALGEQVRRAVEVLIQRLDRADVDLNRELLVGVEPSELYEAALTVMMRIVFLLSAEERGLLLMGDERYEANYAVSTLRMQLRSESEEILERRQDAWSRLLSIFRAVYGGIQHETMRLPALGGSLFDPDRFPFLEGRAKGSNWKFDPAKPLPIDNRTVLLLLDAVQLFQGRTLSYRALDVEQIGYVYEGLLERTVVRAKEVTLDLDAAKKSKKPWVTLDELEAADGNGDKALSALLEERTGSSFSRVTNDLAKQVDESAADKLLTACHGDQALRDRIKPYFHFLQMDRWGYPLVYPEKTFMVTTGTDRRETGTHYTPKSLTEAIVNQTLEPVVYVGPAEGKPRDEWALKSPAELLALKICDPAMGSGAFLVQACRYLSERLVEAWEVAGKRGNAITSEGVVIEKVNGYEPLRSGAEERLLTARRLIAERCLYGVDINPLAVELAKLSIWLVTLAKGRPFGFLDHNLRSGDSLLGVRELEQLHCLDMNPGKGSSKKLFAQKIDKAVEKAIELRLELRSRSIQDIRDVEVMANLDDEAQRELELPELIADALVGEVLAADGKSVDTIMLSIEAGAAMDGGDVDNTAALKRRAHKGLGEGLLTGKTIKRPLHWPLEFPEVFCRENGGFDSLIGNPPFLGNRDWRKTFGEKFSAQSRILIHSPPGKIDLCVLFHRRAVQIMRDRSTYGLIATSNISEGGSIPLGLGAVSKNGDIFFAEKGMVWPGKATVVIAIICFFKGGYEGVKFASGRPCKHIGPRLVPENLNTWVPKKLKSAPFGFVGVDNGAGLSFVIDSSHKFFPILKNERSSILRPYVTGDDITSNALNNVERWALDIGDQSLDFVKANFPEAYKFLDEVVRPNRSEKDLKSRPGLFERWWQFWRPRTASILRVRKQEHIIAYSTATKYPFGIIAPSDWIYTNKVLIIEFAREDMLAICVSSFFREWITKYSGGSLGVTLVLSVKESVSKFPLPEARVASDGIKSARKFNDLAVKWAEENKCGLTDVINAIHSPDEKSEQIAEIREQLKAIDIAVSEAFGWTDLDLSYSFEKQESGTSKDKWRFQISDQARNEVHNRLLALNRDRSMPKGDLLMAGGTT